MDVVYLVSKCPNNNIELRYSLRSLKNIKYDNVFLVWYKPNWVKNVKHIPFNDKDDKFLNVKKKQKIIASHPDISDNFIYMNDDFYFLKPQEVKNYKIWTVDQQVEYIKSVVDNYKVYHYYRSITDILRMFGRWDSYETHTPMIFNKKKMQEVIEWKPDYRTTSFRSLYGNYHSIPAELLTNTPDYKKYKRGCIDCKMYNLEDLYLQEWQLLLSSENKLAKSKEFEIFMDKLFPSKCFYEK